MIHSLRKYKTGKDVQNFGLLLTVCTNALKKIILHRRGQRERRCRGTKDHLIVDKTIQIIVWKDTLTMH